MNTKILKQIKNAWVTLRIIVNNNDENFRKKVSISLNRQKPIKNYDIMYSSPLITSLNNMFIDNDKIAPYFYILKSGEISYDENGCDLLLFAKIFSIYFLQKPGTSKSGTSSLISDSQWKYFEKTETDKNYDECFENKYSIFHNVKIIYDIINKNFSEWVKPLEKHQYEYNIYSFTLEFCTAFFSYVLNNLKKESTSNYTIKDSMLVNSMLVESKVIDALKKLVNKIRELITKKVFVIDANNCKLDSYYIDTFRPELEKDEQLISLIKDCVSYDIKDENVVLE